MKSIFLATPISGFTDPFEYEAFRQNVIQLIDGLRKQYDVYCEIERVADASDYDTPEESVIKDFGKIDQSDVFVMVHLKKCQTSALMELGYAFAKAKKIVLIGPKEKLPYMALGLNVPGHPMSHIEVNELDKQSIRKICYTLGIEEM